ncbi:MAG: peptidylprolyl isomerase [Bacilli bacterium]|nr:peptidylprolyl isomerase [Bacilli bacterium]
MKKKVCYLLAIAMLATGCGKIPTLENGQEAVVTFENGDKISVDELYQEVKDTYALTSLMSLIDTYVLEKTFPDYIDTANEYVENYYKALEENYGGEEALLEALTQSGIASIDAYKKIIYINYMQSHAVEEYAKAQITDKDIEKYYKNDVVGDIEVSHILITPEVTDKMKDSEIKEAEKKAKETAESILKELKETKKADLATKFAELAKEASQDSATKEKGGALGKINKNTLSEDYNELVKAAYNLKDGEYSPKVITTELGYHIIYRTKSYDKASLEDSKKSILETLADNLMADDATVLVDALTHYRKELGMEIQDTELQTQYAYYIQNQIASLTESKNE